jgi:hypothetical protein
LIAQLGGNCLLPIIKLMVSEKPSKIFYSQSRMWTKTCTHCRIARHSPCYGTRISMQSYRRQHKSWSLSPIKTIPPLHTHHPLPPPLMTPSISLRRSSGSRWPRAKHTSSFGHIKRLCQNHKSLLSYTRCVIPERESRPTARPGVSA